jgi:hypothetical protein
VFDSIRRGFGFLGQSIDMARKDGDLVKPSFFGLVASIFVAVIGAIPILVVSLVAGDSKAGQYSLYVLSALVIFAQYATAYIFSGMTAYMVYEYLTHGDGKLDSAWGIIRRDWLDILSLAAASTVVKLIENTLRGRGGRGNLAGSAAAGLINAVWTTATYFVLPAMVIEDLSLRQALKRATYLITHNLLLVAVTEIGVGFVVGLAGFILVLAAVAVGVIIFIALNQVQVIVAIVAAVLVAGVLIALVTAFTSYVTTAYHTALFLWAREAEHAVSLGQSAQSAVAPAPLRAVLAR